MTKGKTRILLVDDEALVREELGGLLEDEGYDVLTAADGEQGLEKFRAQRPDLVITDVRMPRRDGLSLAVTIRAEDPSIPVTVITGHGNEAMAIEALRVGVTDFIKKPVRLEDLISALARMEAARAKSGPFPHELPAAVRVVERSVSYRLGNDLPAVAPFVEHLMRNTVGDLMTGTAAQELSLALRELLINAIEHGNLGVTFDEKSEALDSASMGALIEHRSGLHEFMGRVVTVVVRLRQTRLSVQIADQGDGFDWRSLPDPTDLSNLLRSHGRGILLARMSVDKLSFNDKGNRVTLEKQI